MVETNVSKCSYNEYSNCNLGACLEECKPYQTLDKALEACCSNVNCKGVTYRYYRKGENTSSSSNYGARMPDFYSLNLCRINYLIVV